MYIELKEATHIAEYLMKGAFQKNYPDISIAIGQNVFIGINKVGSRKYGLYFNIEGRKINAPQVHLFKDDISLEELSSSIMSAINNTKPLLTFDFSLDPSLISSSSSTNTEPDIEEDDEIDDDLEDEADELDEQPEPYSAKDEADEIDDADELDEQPEPYSAKDEADSFDQSGELDELDDELNDDLDDELESLEEMDLNKAEASNNREEDFDFDDLAARVDSNKGLAPQHTGLAIHSKRNIDGTLTGVDPGKNRLFHVIDDDVITDNMEKIVAELTVKNKELMTLIYADACTKLLALYNDDIEKMSDATGITKTDILLASYERKFV